MLCWLVVKKGLLDEKLPITDHRDLLQERNWVSFYVEFAVSSASDRVRNLFDPDVDKVCQSSCLVQLDLVEFLRPLELFF
jgi:hypothetical protein